jgi:3-polyprenyl-4-hydroxybenzoate decarboxylase
MSNKHNITLAYTGAGGTIVHRTLLKLLSGDDRVEHINVVASPNGHKLLQTMRSVAAPDAMRDSAPTARGAIMTAVVG